MIEHLTPAAWTNHLVTVEGLPKLLQDGSSMLRVAVTRDRSVSNSLRSELDAFAASHGLEIARADRSTCERLQEPNRMVASIAQRTDLRETLRCCARRIWSDMGYLVESAEIRDVAERHNLSMVNLRQDFRAELNRLPHKDVRLGRDFLSALRLVLPGVIEGGVTEHNEVGRLTSYLSGTLSMSDAFQLGMQRKLDRQTALPILRNFLALNRLAGRSGTLLHIDLTWATDHEALGVNGLTRQSRIWTYQWLRELIDSHHLFDSVFLCIEVGPGFPNPNALGRGWGLYDAVRLRLEDGVHPSDGQNLSAPIVTLEAR